MSYINISFNPYFNQKIKTIHKQTELNNMKQLSLFAITLLFSGITFGQTLKIQTGVSISKLDWLISENGTRYFDETLIGNTFFVGVEYLEKKHLNLSSNIGYLRKGGKDNIVFTDINGITRENNTEKAKLDYFSINTTIDFKYPINEKIIPFVSIGPRIDYLVGYPDVLEGINEMNELNKVNYGFILGGGLRYKFEKIRIGLRADYYLNFNKIAEWPAQTNNLGGKINDKTLLINLSVGYKL